MTSLARVRREEVSDSYCQKTTRSYSCFSTRSPETVSDSY
uniref:SFRICE_002924 n=1 Tax=Spodoptera frugiperda TaxID=7108 RepID=A0A2H1VKU4_SPOFR